VLGSGRCEGHDKVALPEPVTLVGDTLHDAGRVSGKTDHTGETVQTSYGDTRSARGVNVDIHTSRAGGDREVPARRT